MTTEKDDFAKVLAEQASRWWIMERSFAKWHFFVKYATRYSIIEHRVAYFARNFAKSSFSDAA